MVLMQSVIPVILNVVDLLLSRLAAKIEVIRLILWRYRFNHISNSCTTLIQVNWYNWRLVSEQNSSIVSSKSKPKSMMNYLQQLITHPVCNLCRQHLRIPCSFARRRTAQMQKVNVIKLELGAWHPRHFVYLI